MYTQHSPSQAAFILPPPAAVIQEAPGNLAVQRAGHIFHQAAAVLLGRPLVLEMLLGFANSI